MHGKDGPGWLIVFEGIDGSGKSTQARRLVEALQAKGLDATFTREPTDSVHGQEIRRIARDGRQGVTAEAEVELFIADRRIDVAANIAPVLARGGVAVVDRYYLSNVAYQGTLGLDGAAILDRNEAEFPHPDLVLLFDLAPEAALARIRAGRPEGANAGYEQLDFLRRVRESYRAIARPWIVPIDADRPPDVVSAEVDRRVGALLGAAS